MGAGMLFGTSSSRPGVTYLRIYCVKVHLSHVGSTPSASTCTGHPWTLIRRSQTHDHKGPENKETLQVQRHRTLSGIGLVFPPSKFIHYPTKQLNDVARRHDWAKKNVRMRVEDFRDRPPSSDYFFFLRQRWSVTKIVYAHSFLQKAIFVL